MARRSEFVEFVCEQLTFVEMLGLRAMFGGYGVYSDNRIFAIIVDDQLYFKADDMTRAKFESKGLRPFTYASRGKTVAMQYFAAPAETFDEPEAMRFWVEIAREAAARAGKRTRGRARTFKRT